MFASFLNFALAIRCCSHLGYLIGANAGQVRMRRLASDTAAGGAGGGAGGAPLLTSANPPREATVMRQVSVGPDAVAVTMAEHVAVVPMAGTRDWYGSKAEALVRLLAIHFSLGLRFLYLSIPFAFYAGGPVAFVVSAIAMQVFLVYVDHATS
jgi:hypothetical protein